MEIPAYLINWFWLMAAFVFFVNLFLIDRLYKSQSKRGMLLHFINIVWPVFTLVLAYQKLFIDFSLPPKFALVIFGDLAILIFLFRYVKTKDYLLKAFPIVFLILIQIVRFPLELWLGELCESGLNACSMTYHGYNFDVITAATAPVIAFLAFKDSKKYNSLIKAWNYMGLFFIVVVVAVAVLSTPVPFRVFTEGLPNTVVAYYPYVLLPSFIVPSAVLYHILCLQKLKLISQTNH